VKPSLLDQRTPGLLQQRRAFNRHRVVGVLFEFGVIVTRAQDGDLVKLGLLGLDDVGEVLELVVPS
jgi:hypothetical protein